MSKSAKTLQYLNVVLALALLFGAAYVLWLVVTQLLKFLNNANPSFSAAVVGAMATALVGLGGVLYTQAQIKRRDIEDAHRSRKVEIYKGFLDVVARVMAKDNKNVSLEPISDQDLVNFLVEFKSNIILWASPKVINAQLNFEKVSSSDGNSLIAVDQLYKAIREDIGLSNRGLDKHQLIKMYLNDPDEMDRASASNSSLQKTSLTGRHE
ncbi:hypothetical protein DFR26_0522 [Paraperlucidibaca baekdonensis]|uniref:Uncharacterized protein n=1 Tax=Paraperlucidibaca baekdonensis TaxID=748120 RepID=A0A3E0HAR7_9GAMM|nr:hypothetical protein [Paraperlucidibaca baekdonensis]REH40322.1 hypothetical protein DFR26_0522 [Paraperlucidibaca baekdonensis]